MSTAQGFPKYIFGMHEPGGEYLMEEKGKRGWLVFTHGIGRDPANVQGQDYRPWSQRGFGILARLNHGYGSAGTIPLPAYYDAFAKRVGSFVQHSSGCAIWIIGNEMNHAQERPEGQIITPDQYASCYTKCRDQIHGLPGHEQDQVVMGAIAPWNNTTTYPGNEGGDWIKYFVDAIRAIRGLGSEIDAIALHAYTHGTEPGLVFSEQRMNPPFQNYHYQFRCYQDFMGVIPQDLRHLPLYVTETDQNDPWRNENTGWVRNAYREINTWNAAPGHQQIRALALYRWPRYDKWYIDGKSGVHDDFRAAMENEYTWKEIPPIREINGHLVQGPFLAFFERMGQALCGLPISDELVENGLKTQYFEMLVLQQDAAGNVFLKAIGTEVKTLREALYRAEKQVAALRFEIGGLNERIANLEEELAHHSGGADQQILEIPRPMWDNVVYGLARHPTKRYETRNPRDVKHLVITHSAIPPTVGAAAIADFHVKQMQWPGIGCHFFIGGDGQILKTNEISTVCYHVGEWDPTSIGICVAGNFTQVIPTPEQIQSIAHLLAWLMQELDLPVEAVKGKQELVDTQSPGLQWLGGKKWKETLLAGVAKERVERLRPHPRKLSYHYLLFWQNANQWAEESWLGAKSYVGRFRVTHGFLPDDARTYRFVTIVGGTSGVSQAVEKTLVDAGCRVERIAGKTDAETSQILAEMAARGQRFLDYAG